MAFATSLAQVVSDKIEEISESRIFCDFEPQLPTFWSFAKAATFTGRNRPLQFCVPAHVASRNVSRHFRSLWDNFLCRGIVKEMPLYYNLRGR